MSNVVRLVSGGSIQVRTGVLQGIGPQGPRGVAGPQGDDGPQGQQGDPGPMGQILQLMSKTAVANNNAIAANTDTTISFGTVAFDDLNCFSSISNVVLSNAGDYLLSCWLKFDAAGTTGGSRQIWFSIGGVTVARSTRSSVASTNMFVDLCWPYRAAGNSDVFNVLVRSDTALGISSGALSVNRMGSGPPGGPGPIGLTGNPGPAGPKGDQGDDGSASSGFAHYSDLLP